MESKVLRMPQDIFEALNRRSFEQDDDCWQNTLRKLLGLDEIPLVDKKPKVKKSRFKYDVTELAVGETKIFYDVHPELCVPSIHRYARTRGKHFMCQGGPGCVTVTRMK